ncbi:Gag polyprotein [Carex littledalei]|uniref:Gag polyprotein n=1 Tax=Carex littledalei TaxID=544730 RepID=A0A833RE15_9POAL|nr:Gag polyprotein [Carex littledalei]
MAGDGEWQEVKRRRRYPDHWRTPTDDRNSKVRPYKPFQGTRSYAQVVQNSPASSRGSASSNSAASSPINSRPVSPASSTSPRYYYSPHSPTKLRFPPLPSYPEWWGRCFNCCQLGHTSSKCRNPKCCGKCWTPGHTARHCPITDLNPAAPPYYPKPHQTQPQHTEPLFDELLVGDIPPPPVMPEGRPAKTICFIERDNDYYAEIERLQRAVVLNGEHGRRVLRELCNGVNPNNIPPEVLAVLTGDSNMAELSLATLKDLMHATEDQEEEVRVAQAPPVMSQELQLPLVATPIVTLPSDSRSNILENVAYPSSVAHRTVPPSMAQGTRDSKDKRIEVNSAPKSVQGTVCRGANEETEAADPRIGMGCGHTSGLHEDNSLGTHTRESQQIRRRSKPVQPVTRHGNNALKQIRVRGMLGRGTAKPPTSYLAAGHFRRGARVNQWVRPKKLPQEITHPLLPKSTTPVGNSAFGSHIPSASAEPQLGAQSNLTGPNMADPQLAQKSDLVDSRPNKAKETQSPTGTNPALNQSTPPLAEISFSPSGHLQVQIQQSHGEQIAALCGVTTEDEIKDGSFE